MHGSSANTMDAVLLAWCVGVVTALLFSRLPVPAEGFAAAVVGIALLAGGRSPQARAVGAVLLGLAYGTYAGREALDHRLPQCAAGRTVSFTGRLLSVAGDRRFSRVEVAVLGEIAVPGGACPSRARRLRLSWRQADAAAPGEVWRFDVRLRSPRGMQNPGGFDYEGWLLARRVDATGYVRRARLMEPAGPIEHHRNALRNRLRQGGLANADVLEALIFGASNALGSERWDVLRRTGTVHLMVVSGLHIGFIAGFGFVLGRCMVSLPVLLRHRSARLGGTVLALAAATGYATLAGWPLPVQRAWLMAAVLLVCVQLGRGVSLRRGFLLTLAVVVTVEPLAGLLSGFWLSFGAVALLLGYFGPRPDLGWVRGLLHAQLLLLVGMSPLLIRATSEVPLLAPLANLVAVPLVTGLVVPGALIGGLVLGVHEQGGLALLGAADALAGILFRVLHALADLGPPVSVPSANEPYPQNLLAAGLGLGLVTAALLPQPVRSRVLLLAGLTLLPVGPAPPAPGTFRLTMLDVGQGLAVHIVTARHTLLYDAGARYPTGFDVGAAVVVPAVRSAGISRLDMLLISHADIDHRGGAAAVAAALAPRWSLGTQAPDAPCRLGLRWQWDGVAFEILHPAPGVEARTDNDRSCVLRVSGARAKALLPGDIERDAELQIVKAGAGRVTLLVAPHHGSRTSSSRQLIHHLHPAVVLISAGYDNRFGHPHADVLARYRAAGLIWYSTAAAGALTWASNAPGRVSRQRAGRGPYWRVR